MSECKCRQYPHPARTNKPKMRCQISLETEHVLILYFLDQNESQINPETVSTSQKELQSRGVEEGGDAQLQGILGEKHYIQQLDVGAL